MELLDNFGGNEVLRTDCEYTSPNIAQMPRVIIASADDVQSNRVSKQLLNTIVETIASFSHQEIESMMDMTQFSTHFKQERTRRGLTQLETGKLICDVANRQFSQTTISRFEEMKMPFLNMSKLQSKLQAFTDLTDEQVHNISISVPSHPRRRRAKLSKEQIDQLEEFYKDRRHRDSKEMKDIGLMLQLDTYVGAHPLKTR
uniref:POU-specific domain-containing protein n=2 Tax=Steinernema glaseri TaxID=37863 RepID=A0A1I8ARV6_9BILA